MIDFRYHLVSLIGVFLALAIGVVLGAGPLQSRVGNAWNSDDQTTSADLADELEQVRAQSQAEEAALTDLAQRVLPGTLDGVGVAVVTLPGTSTDDVDALAATLRTAGAQVVAQVSLTDNWQSPSMAQYRDTLAGPLSTHLSAPVPDDATADAVIGYALVEVLTSSGSERDLVSDILTDSSTPLMKEDQAPDHSAQAIVVVGPRSVSGGTKTPGSESGQSGDQSSQATSAWAGLARAVAAAPAGAVVLGDAASPSSLVSQIRTQGVLVTTVDSVGTEVGTLGAALALPGSAGATEARAFGVGDAALSVLPPIPGVE